MSAMPVFNQAGWPEKLISGSSAEEEREPSIGTVIWLGVARKM